MTPQFRRAERAERVEGRKHAHYLRLRRGDAMQAGTRCSGQEKDRRIMRQLGMFGLPSRSETQVPRVRGSIYLRCTQLQCTSTGKLCFSTASLGVFHSAGAGQVAEHGRWQSSRMEWRGKREGPKQAKLSVVHEPASFGGWLYHDINESRRVHGRRKQPNVVIGE